MTTPNNAPIPFRELMEQHSRAGNAADVVYAVLRQSIIEGRFPPGTRFRAEELAKEMGVSRTPIREAHLRLEAEGLLVVQPGAGLVVRDFSDEQVLETYYVREALEGMAARLAAENATPRQIGIIRDLVTAARAAVEAGDFALVRNVSGEFHLAVCTASHNRALFTMIEEIQETFRRFQPTTLTNRERANEAVGELDAIATAIAKRDPVSAEAAARLHRRRTLQLHTAKP